MEAERHQQIKVGHSAVAGMRKELCQHRKWMFVFGGYISFWFCIQSNKLKQKQLASDATNKPLVLHWIFWWAFLTLCEGERQDVFSLGLERKERVLPMESTSPEITPWSPVKKTCLHWHHGICLGVQWSEVRGPDLGKEVFCNSAFGKLSRAGELLISIWSESVTRNN